MEENKLAMNEKKKNMEENIFTYYKQIVDERMKKEISLESEEKKLEEVKKHLAYFKDEVDEFEIFTPKVNYSLEMEKKQSLTKEKQQLEEKITTEKEEIALIRKKEADTRNLLSWIKSVKVVEEQEDKFVTDNEKIYMLEIQEIERKRIARELHDSATQNLIALCNKAELCYNLVDIDGIRCKLELQSMMKYLRSIIDDIRETIYDLRPMSFDDIGMKVTINQFIEKLKADTNKKIAFNDDENILDEYNLKSVLKLTIFRIIQESCNNAVKHSQAENIRVEVKKEGELLSVIISDDGIGFDVSMLDDLERKDNSGFGLSMMRERVYLLSGEFNINSKIGQGTIISVKVPFLEED